MGKKEMGLEDAYGILRTLELKGGKIQRTDLTNAECLVNIYGSEIRYNPMWKKWLVWNGKFWETDEGEVRITKRCIEMIRSLYDKALKADDYKERIEIEKFAMQSENFRRLGACVQMAAKLEAIQITSEELDTNPWLLNVENGTVDVSTGEFREHRKEDYITKIAKVSFDPLATCVAWKNFICEIMNFDIDIITFLQTAAGWGITGDTSEQTMFIFFGSGANGKSTFLNTIMNILGEYAASTQTETFIKQNAERISNDIARLRGTRFVTTSETEYGRRLSEPLIKQITGNDKLTARFLYGEYFSFLPTFKIFMATNHKPVIKGTDHGIWRRIKLVPFTQTIPAEKQDKELEQKLFAERSGILNWLIEGAMRWKRERFRSPECITYATNEYRAEMDVIGNFLKERCVLNPSCTIRIRELFKAYQDWCDDNNEHAVSERFFSLRLKELGYTQGRTADARYWNGIMLRATLLP
jgi:putative DNA primase/helicase